MSTITLQFQNIQTLVSAKLRNKSLSSSRKKYIHTYICIFIQIYTFVTVCIYILYIRYILHILFYVYYIYFYKFIYIYTVFSLLYQSDLTREVEPLRD